ncbi:MAG: hypothetical protein QXP02_03355 [Desulfurococcaceae archaeon]
MPAFNTWLLIILLMASLIFLGISVFLSLIDKYIQALFSFIAGLILLSSFLALVREFKLRQ